MIPTVSWVVVVLFNCNWPPETPNDSLCLAVCVSQHHVGGSRLFLARLILIIGPTKLVLKDLNIWCWCLDFVIGTVELKHVLCWVVQPHLFYRCLFPALKQMGWASDDGLGLWAMAGLTICSQPLKQTCVLGGKGISNDGVFGSWIIDKNLLKATAPEIS